MHQDNENSKALLEQKLPSLSVFLQNRIKESRKSLLPSNSIFLCELLDQIHPSTETKIILAELYFEKRNYEKVVQILDRFESPEARYISGMALFKMDKLKEAEKAIVISYCIVGDLNDSQETEFNSKQICKDFCTEPQNEDFYEQSDKSKTLLNEDSERLKNKFKENNLPETAEMKRLFDGSRKHVESRQTLKQPSTQMFRYSTFNFKFYKYESQIWPKGLLKLN